jgi:DNA-binding NtrC family response regulator
LEKLSAATGTPFDLETLSSCSVPRPPDLAIVGSIHGDGASGIEKGRSIRLRFPDTPLVFITGRSSEELAIAALRLGVSDYLKQPSLAEQLVFTVKRLLNLPNASQSAAAAIPMIGESKAIRETKQFIRQFSRIDSNVLITGETGTGKELVADLIHTESTRRGRPFVCVNCPAIPDSLLESELFGYERGAFTGAHASHTGLLEAAAGGTVFLDEIGDLSLVGQSKVLRAIEGRKFYRLGGSRTIHLDIRIVSATNQRLEEMMAANRFRKDLYYRLCVASVHLSPLRERKEDIPLLCRHYVQDFSRQFHRRIEGVSDSAMKCLLKYDWPGNVRELKNILEIACAGCEGPWIEMAALPPQLLHIAEEREEAESVQRDRLLSALIETSWNCSKAAERLRWSRMTVYRKMAKFQLSRPKNGSSPARLE